MSHNLTHGVPLSPAYGCDEQEDLIWVPVRVPKGSSHSPPTHNQNFYPAQQVPTAPYFPPVSWGHSSTMMTTAGSYSGISVGATMDWPSNQLPVGGEFDTALALELETFLGNHQVEPHTDFMNHSPDLVSGLDPSDPILGLPDLGLGFAMPDAFGNGSPIDNLYTEASGMDMHSWMAFDHSYSPTPSGSCSPPATSSSPMTDSTISIPPTPVTSDMFVQPDASPMFPPITCRASKHTKHQTTSTLVSRPRQRRTSPASHPREGGSGGSFRCALCDKPHLDNRALSRHLWAQHPDHAARTKTKSERAQCPLCDYSGRGDNLVRHMKRHAK